VEIRKKTGRPLGTGKKMENGFIFMPYLMYTMCKWSDAVLVSDISLLAGDKRLRKGLVIVTVPPCEE